MVNFARHYHVDERLLAKCEGDIQVELLEAGTGERFREPLVGCRAEVRQCCKGGVPVSTRSGSGCLFAVHTRCACVNKVQGLAFRVQSHSRPGCLCQQGPGMAVWLQFTADQGACVNKVQGWLPGCSPQQTRCSDGWPSRSLQQGEVSWGTWKDAG